MLRKILKSKIHRARITDANLEYEGSITIDKELMNLAELKPFEFVDVWNVTNGSRFETYVIEGDFGKRDICVNGAAARLVAKNDFVIIASHSFFHENELENFKPKIVFVDDSNNPLK